MTDEIRKKRRSKYERPKGKRPNLRIQERDRELIRLLGLYRFGWSSDLVACVAESLRGTSTLPTPAGTLKRLGELLLAGYLDIPDNQPGKERQKKGTGSLPKVYALGDRGAPLFHEITGQRPPEPPRTPAGERKRSWRDKNREIKQDSVKHRLIMSRFMLALEREVVGNGLEVMQPHELVTVAGPDTRRRTKPFHWSFTINYHGHEVASPITPDYSFALRRPTTGEAILSFVEADTTSETNIPKGTRAAGYEKATIYRKCAAFAVGNRRKVVAPRFGFGGFQVLWITSGGEARMRNMAKSAMAAFELVGGGPPGLFLFTREKWIHEYGPFKAPWINARGDRIDFRMGDAG